MKNLIKKISAAVLVVAISVTGVSTIVSSNASATQTKKTEYNLSTGMSAAKTNDQEDTLFGEGGIFTKIVNILLFLIGALSVVMLIYGGIQYVLSTGDSGKVTNAKNTILYAVVGLIVAILSYAIVNFVLTSLNGNN